MELKELTDKTLKLFKATTTNMLLEKIYKVCINNETDIYNKFKELVDNDLETDYLQKIFQYYEADRENKGQDYTPKCLSKLVAKLSQDVHESECLDLCAGSGTLTIQKWITNNNLKFVCKEYDSKVIPCLLFNLSIRNIEGTVEQIDVLQNETLNKYKIIKGEEFGKVVIDNENMC